MPLLQTPGLVICQLGTADTKQTLTKDEWLKSERSIVERRFSELKQQDN
jgi:hypothetical protein